MTALPVRASVWRARTLRARAVRSAGISVFLGACLVGAVALFLVDGAVRRSLDDTLRARTGDVRAQLLESHPGTSDPVQLPPLDPRDPVVVQVADAAGRVLATTSGVGAGTRICAAQPPPSVRVDDVTLAQPSLHGTFRVLVTPVQEGRAGRLQVCAARSDEQAETTRNGVLAALALAVPTVTALACLLARYQVAGALDVVSGLAHEADRLQSLEEGRLRVPATGDEVSELATTFNALLDRVHTQSTAVRQFVADAGHELRTPLASLQVCLDLAAEATPQEARRAARDGLVDVRRLTGLVEDLLASARLDAGEALRPVPVRLPDVLDAEVSLARRLRPGRVTVDVTGGVVAALADPWALRRTVANLLSNAVRHAESAVEVAVSAADGRVVVEVRDDGAGVPAGQLDRIFGRFVRLDDARSRDEGGIGLGLAIAASLTARGGGDLTAAPGPGGRFVLRLPAAP